MSGALDGVINEIYCARNAESEIENYSGGGKQTSGDVYARYASLSAHYWPQHIPYCDLTVQFFPGSFHVVFPQQIPPLCNPPPEVWSLKDVHSIHRMMAVQRVFVWDYGRLRCLQRWYLVVYWVTAGKETKHAVVWASSEFATRAEGKSWGKARALCRLLYYLINPITTLFLPCTLLSVLRLSYVRHHGCVFCYGHCWIRKGSSEAATGSPSLWQEQTRRGVWTLSRPYCSFTRWHARKILQTAKDISSIPNQTAAGPSQTQDSTQTAERSTNDPDSNDVEPPSPSLPDGNVMQEEPEYDPTEFEQDEDEAPQFPISHEVVLKDHTKVVSALALDPSGARVVSGSHDYDCKLWDFGGMDMRCKPFKSWEPAGSYHVCLDWCPMTSLLTPCCRYTIWSSQTMADSSCVSQERSRRNCLTEMGRNSAYW